MLKEQLLFVPQGNLYGFSHPVGWFVLFSKLMILRYRMWIWAWDPGLTAAPERCKNKKINKKNKIKNSPLCKPYASTAITSFWLTFLV